MKFFLITSVVALASATALPGTTASMVNPGWDSIPACGQYCITSMWGKASKEMGCKPGFDRDCACKRVNFFYGLRDCSAKTCGPGPKGQANVLSYYAGVCAGY